MSPLVRKIFLGVSSPLLLLGCGGGGGGGSDGPAPVSSSPPPAATAPTIVKVGPVTGFGSVFVDGERFETSRTGTTYRVDDNPSTEDQLEVGMIVRVRSSSKNSAGEWIADDVEFDEDLKGPVDSVGSSSFVALGQTVNVTGDTFMDDGLTLATLSAGDIVEVSGYRNQLDEIDATYVELKSFASVEKFEVLGQVRDLDSSAMVFRLGGLTVDYSSARVDDVAGGLANSMLVQVEDEARTYAPGDLSLVATEVEGEFRGEFKDEDDNDADGDGRDDTDGHRSGDDSDQYEVKGLVTEVVDVNSFLLGSFQVRHDSTTEFSGGLAEDIAIGVKLEVEGDLDENGILNADEIGFESTESRVSGLVTGVDSSGALLEVMGLTIDTSGAELEDDRDDLEPFTLDDISEGDYVAVEGSEGDDNTIRAQEIEREDADRSALRGLVDDFDRTARTVTILGMLINTDTNTRYEVDEDSSVGADAFFDRLHIGQSVVDADWVGAQMDTLSPARELSLED